MLWETIPIPPDISLQQIYTRLPLSLPGTVVLDSGAEPSPAGKYRLARYTIIAQDPFGVLEANREDVCFRSIHQNLSLEGDPLEILQAVLNRYSDIAPEHAVTPLPAGAVGFLNYGLKAWIEPCPNQLPALNHLPLYWFGLYDAISTIDLDRRLIIITSTGIPEQGVARRIRAQARLEALRQQWYRVLRQGAEQVPTFVCRAVESVWSRGEYRRAHKRVKEYIAAGDVYQVNLSQAFYAPFEGSAASLFLHARRISPTPFSAWLQTADFAIISLSPERLLHFCPRTRRLQTRPIKGTRPRHPNPVLDQRYARELQQSPKDRAEHVMIVDLERNDLGRIAQIGSVKVTELMVLEGFAQVYHLTSTVEATARPEVNVAALLRAIYPGGSITGAPKIRAMQIIEEVEAVAREAFTGSIGYFGFHGGIDLNIAIRTAVVSQKRLTFYAGGGIVADSDADQEYEETLCKAEGWFQSIRNPQGHADEPVDMVQRTPVP